MLNRTNRTLSANLNRLNLGTRSLAAQAGLVNVGTTLRIRNGHLLPKRTISMRFGDADPADTWMYPAMATAAPSSPPATPRPEPARCEREAEVVAVVRPVVTGPAVGTPTGVTCSTMLRTGQARPIQRPDQPIGWRLPAGGHGGFRKAGQLVGPVALTKAPAVATRPPAILAAGG